MDTTLNLLTCDGVVHLSFRPGLTGQQYSELLRLVEQSTSAEDMRDVIRKWTERHRLQVGFEE